MSESLTSHVQQIGKGVVQANLRLARVLDALESTPSAAKPEASASSVVSEALFDLIDSLDIFVDGAPDETPAPGWFRRLVGGQSPQSSRQREHHRGLTMARDRAVEQLSREGIQSMERTGPFEPAHHQAVERVPTVAGAIPGTIACTHRRGWLRLARGGPQVLRCAQVGIFDESNSA